MRRPVLLLLLLLLATSALFGQVLITSTSPLPTGYAGIPYTYTFTAQVVPMNLTVTWSLSPTAGPPPLPPGLTLSPNGTLSGTPSAAQAAPFVFTVFAQAGNFTTSMQFSLTIQQPTITINSSSPLPNAFMGQFYTDTLVGSSTPAGITWFLSDNPTPPGLSLSTNGVISGNPTTPGTYNFTIVAQITSAGTNCSTCAITKNFSMTVYAGQINIQTTSLPQATSGKPYTATLAVTPTGVTWALSGVLPSGITFNTATGVFSGTLTAVGIYPLQLTASLTNYPNASTNLNLDVTMGPLAIPQPTLPNAVQSSPYVASGGGAVVVGATGGIPPYQFVFVNTSNDGLVISPSGTITGTPVSAGSFLLPVTLSDATGQNVTVNLSLFVATPLTVLTTSLANGSLNVAYSQTLQAGGGTPPITWIIVAQSGSLPPGLSLSPAGTISGTPTTGGTFTFTVQVTDSGKRTASKALSIAVSVANLSITTNSLPTAILGVAYSQTVAVTGGATPYTWRLAAGGFPQGLTINPSTGVLSGTPNGSVGASTFTVQVTDSSSPVQTVTKAYTVNVALTLTITTLSLPAGTKGSAYSGSLAASGGITPYTWSVTSGSLPPGLNLNSTSGGITGTPTATGSTVFTVTVADSSGQTANGQFSLAINAATSPLTITTTSFSATVGTAVSEPLTATGGTPPYTFSATGLPAGLSVTGSSITGTPTAAGTPSVTLTVTDSQKQTATATITITVTLPPAPPASLKSIGGTAATQASPGLTLNAPYPVALTGTLTASFQSAVGGSPTEVGFVSSGGGLTSSVTFNIPAGSTAAVFSNSPALATGTVAGTITLTATLNAGGTDITPSPAPTETVTISPAAPVIETVKFSSGSGGLTVNVIGYSTTREMVSGQFQFFTSTGPILTPVTVQLSSAFSSWYSSSSSNQYGSQFTLTIPFSVSGNAQDIVSVNAVLTNTKGASNSLQSASSN